MKTQYLRLATAMSITIPAISPARAVTADIVATPAYRWSADSIIQGPYKAYADGPFRIVSDYAAEPGYHMPIDKVWERKKRPGGISPPDHPQHAPHRHIQYGT